MLSFGPPMIHFKWSWQTKHRDYPAFPSGSANIQLPNVEFVTPCSEQISLSLCVLSGVCVSICLLPLNPCPLSLSHFKFTFGCKVRGTVTEPGFPAGQTAVRRQQGGHPWGRGLARADSLHSGDVLFLSLEIGCRGKNRLNLLAVCALFCLYGTFQ